jgi:DNA topoisomerase-3
MSKALIIAEKPSVANDIARALGGFTKHDEYYESDDYVLSSAVGHLLEIAAPEEYEVKRGKWSFANLPVIPPHFDLNPIAKSESRLKVLTKLLKRKDVERLINACDAGREGELIFRLIAQHAKAKQPVQRLWLQSMTPAAIRDGFARLRSDEEMQPLADAARCRSEADWLVGINGTRHDGVQQQGRRFLPDYGWPGADAHTVDRGRARREDSPLRAARLLGSEGRIRLRRRLLRGPLVRPEIQAR